MADAPAARSTPLIPPEPPAPWSLGMPPEVMAAVLTNLLREHFSDPRNVVEPTLRDLPWTPDPALPGRSSPASAILIDTVDVWSPGLVELRPGIVVKDHAWKPLRQGIADLHQGGAAADGSERYTTLYASAVTMFAIAGAPLEAKKLGTEVLRLLVQFAELIRCEFALTRFMPTERGECFILEESEQHFAVPVTVAFMATESWSVTRQSPKLRKIILQVVTSLR